MVRYDVPIDMRVPVSPGAAIREGHLNELDAALEELDYPVDEIVAVGSWTMSSWSAQTGANRSWQ